MLFPDPNEWSQKSVQRIKEMCLLLSEGREDEAVAKVHENIADNWERFELHQFD